jgi:hypothetical protein
VKRLGDLEADVMEQMWALDRPLTTSHILTELNGGWDLARSTVIRLLDNLPRKGWFLRRTIKKSSCRHIGQQTPVHLRSAVARGRARLPCWRVVSLTLRIQTHLLPGPSDRGVLSALEGLSSALRRMVSERHRPHLYSPQMR